MDKKHIFTTNEKRCFMELIKKYSRIIESKDTDGASLKSKNEAWDKVTVEFNSSPLATSPATHKQLRRLWMNLKQRQRESSKGHQYKMPIDKQVTIPTEDYKLDIVEREYRDRQKRADEKHELELQILRELLRECKAKADMAELILEQDINSKRHDLKSWEKSNGDIKLSVLKMEYMDQKKRAGEKHELELQIRSEQIRECKAKADLAELILKQDPSPD